MPATSFESRRRRERKKIRKVTRTGWPDPEDGRIQPPFIRPFPRLEKNNRVALLLIVCALCTPFSPLDPLLSGKHVRVPSSTDAARNICVPCSLKRVPRRSLNMHDATRRSNHSHPFSFPCPPSFPFFSSPSSFSRPADLLHASRKLFPISYSLCFVSEYAHACMQIRVIRSFVSFRCARLDCLGRG